MGQVTTMGLGRVAMVRDFLRGALTDALFMATAIDNTGILSLLEAQDTLYIYMQPHPAVSVSLPLPSRIRKVAEDY